MKTKTHMFSSFAMVIHHYIVKLKKNSITFGGIEYFSLLIIAIYLLLLQVRQMTLILFAIEIYLNLDENTIFLVEKKTSNL